AAARVLIAVFATLLADAVLLHLTGSNADPNSGLVSAALFVIIAWFTGYIVRQRRRYALRLQDEAASKAVAEERLRIARELHDVVAHSMSVIAVQAGYGQYVIDTQPGDARDALGAIQATSREAVDVTRCGQPRDLPASIDLSAYRIVQEALTNVVKHACTSSCRVLIGYGQDELILEVTDNGAGLPAMAGAAMAGAGVSGTGVSGS